MEATDRNTGGDGESEPAEVPALTEQLGPGTAAIALPSAPGAYRLFLYVRDDRGNAATANVPLLVGDNPQ